jgi:hypothetical protein
MPAPKNISEYRFTGGKTGWFIESGRGVFLSQNAILGLLLGFKLLRSAVKSLDGALYFYEASSNHLTGLCTFTKRRQIT